MSEKISAGAKFPEITLPTANGDDLRLGGAREGWQLIVVYRGLHCPLCKKYLTKLEGLKADFEGIGTEAVTLSGDPKEKAVALVEELGLTMPVAYGLGMDQMRTLGLYISEPRPESV